MKILYGVQGTGNGHLSRARAMARAFIDSGIEVDYLFSGRPPERFFDMECFGSYVTRRGLSFVNRNGRVDYRRTLLGNDYLRFLRDVLTLDVAGYDAVLTDFEPITAWAGRLRGKQVISLGHQPAFDYAVPVADRDLRTLLVMRLFAPGDVRIGMHWDKFAAPILPPLVDVGESDARHRPDKVLVYLPFESQARVQALLAGIDGYDFYVYAPELPHEQFGHLHLRPISLAGFRADLHDCSAVLCNAGFELTSECLALGKRLLVKPQGRQMEQASNALALRELGYGDVMDELDADRIGTWLAREEPAPQLCFPDVATAIVRWPDAGDLGPTALEALSSSLWQQVRVRTGPVARLTAQPKCAPRRIRSVALP